MVTIIKEIEEKIFNRIEDELQFPYHFTNDILEKFTNDILQYQEIDEWFSVLSAVHRYKQSKMMGKYIYNSKKERNENELRSDLAKLYYSAVKHVKNVL